jgi:hypothetical protein
MKAKAPLGAVSKYVSDGLAHPSKAEEACGWRRQSLTDYLKASTSTAYEFRRELLLRARDRELHCKQAVDRFKMLEDMNTPNAKKALVVLERELADARADVEFAVNALDAAEAGKVVAA